MSDKIEVGDRVKCVSPGYSSLELGREYTVKWIKWNAVEVEGISHLYDLNRFELVAKAMFVEPMWCNDPIPDIKDDPVDPQEEVAELRRQREILWDTCREADCWLNRGGPSSSAVVRKKIANAIHQCQPKESTNAPQA